METYKNMRVFMYLIFYHMAVVDTYATINRNVDFNIFPLVQGCIKHRLEVKCLKLDLADVIVNECAVCPDFTNM